MATTTSVRPVPPADGTMTRRDEIAVAIFGTWMIVGLFLDGWAHRTDLPETFFSPWHAVLYSGFVAGMAYFAGDAVRRRRKGEASVATDRLTILGLVLFVAGAVTDGVWHQVFGIEAGIEALLSPTHLGLMAGGILMVSGPLRSAWARPGDHPGFWTFLPTTVSVALGTAVVGFFVMYLSAFDFHPLSSSGLSGEFWEIHGLASIFVTNALLLFGMLLVLRRWTPPFGTFALLFGGVGVAMTGLAAFENVWLVIPAVVAGISADVVVARTSPGRARMRLAGAVVPLVWWSSWFAAQHAVVGVGWAPELWTGAIILTVLAGLGLSVLAEPPPVPADR